MSKVKTFLVTLLLILAIVFSAYGANKSSSKLAKLKPHQAALLEVGRQSCRPYFTAVSEGPLMDLPGFINFVIHRPNVLGKMDFYSQTFTRMFSPYVVYNDYIIPGSFGHESRLAWDSLTGELPVHYIKEKPLSASFFYWGPVNSWMLLFHGRIEQGVNLGVAGVRVWRREVDSVLRHEIMEAGDSFTTIKQAMFLQRMPELFYNREHAKRASRFAPFNHAGVSPMLAEMAVPGYYMRGVRKRTGEAYYLDAVLEEAAKLLDMPFMGHHHAFKLICKIKSDPELLLRVRNSIGNGYAHLAEVSRIRTMMRIRGIQMKISNPSNASLKSFCPAALSRSKWFIIKNTPAINVIIPIFPTLFIDSLQ